MKKILGIVVLIIVVIMLISPEKEVRIRVIANSDSQYDQNVKIVVAKRLKDLLEETRDLDIIKKEVEYLISDYHCDYSVNVTYKKQKYSPKQVDSKVIPGGVYKTLVIELGTASGKNYWSMLYPEYFNVSFEEVNNGDVEFGWWFTEIFKGESYGNNEYEFR